MRITELYINKLYDKLKNKAKNSFKRNDFDNSLIYLQGASFTAYNFHLGFKDDDIESMLKNISKILKKNTITEAFDNNKCVFFDSFSLDHQALTQQYIKAIIQSGWNLLYITEANINSERAKDIKNEIMQYDKSSIIQIPSDIRGIDRSQFIYDSIIKFEPSKLFMHILPNAVYAATAFYALPKGIDRFQINLTDHTFWIGKGCLDYSIEFRPLGALLSLRRRLIPKNNIFIIPYYPIISSTKFQGLPYQCEDKIVVLSGGAYYKILDEKNTFFKLMKIILEISENVIIIFAGRGDPTLFQKFIKENNYEDRLILIGYRKDINEVFKKSDIYLNTYPFIGGLMCQYAALNSKPILSYYSEKTSKAEETVCQKKHINISLSDFESFRLEAEKFIFDKQYRESRGKDLKSCIVDESDFNEIFIRTITKKKNLFDFSLDDKYKDNDTSAKIKYENQTNEYKKSIVKIIGFKSIFLFPNLFLDVMINILQKRSVFVYLKKHIKKKI